MMIQLLFDVIHCYLVTSVIFRWL